MGVIPFSCIDPFELRQVESYLKDMGMTGLASVCLGDGQTEAYLKDMDMTGLASAWAMARRSPI